jgi:hypothetical protein
MYHKTVNNITLLDHKPRNYSIRKPDDITRGITNTNTPTPTPTPTSNFGIDTWGISSCDGCKTPTCGGKDGQQASDPERQKARGSDQTFEMRGKDNARYRFAHVFDIHHVVQVEEGGRHLS